MILNNFEKIILLFSNCSLCLFHRSQSQVYDMPLRQYAKIISPLKWCFMQSLTKLFPLVCHLFPRGTCEGLKMASTGREMKELTDSNQCRRSHPKRLLNSHYPPRTALGHCIGYKQS